MSSIEMLETATITKVHADADGVTINARSLLGKRLVFRITGNELRWSVEKAARREPDEVSVLCE